jgi:tripartite-type tricarboxylate transporter receptor subunit TctC
VAAGASPRKAAATPEWKTDLDRNYWTSDFKPAAAFAKELEKDYAEMRTRADRRRAW